MNRPASQITLISSFEAGIAIREACVDALFIDGKSNCLGAIMEGASNAYTEDRIEQGRLMLKLYQRFPELYLKFKCPRKGCEESEMSLMNIMMHLEESCHNTPRDKVLQWLRHLKKTGRLEMPQTVTSEADKKPE